MITGTTQGMNETHAGLYIEEGTKVVLTDINIEKGERVTEDIDNNALFIQHDITKKANETCCQTR